MCAILGALLVVKNPNEVLKANLDLALLMKEAVRRGRDGFGYVLQFEDRSRKIIKSNECFTDAVINENDLIPSDYVGTVRFISNFRAEPTTEYIKDKRIEDQQPYAKNNWTIVHNGTIANDHELRQRYATEGFDARSVETHIDSAAIVENLDYHSDRHSTLVFKQAVSELVGSFAIIATTIRREQDLYLACNYRPIWAFQTSLGVMFASCESYFYYSKNSFKRPFMLEPYHFHFITMEANGPRIISEPLVNTISRKKSLVVCSGGLDSVVSAKKVQSEGDDITLIHFLYGSRAEGPEVEAVKRVAESLKCPLVLFPLSVYDKKDSPLLQEVANIAEGESGAEYAHEWVPARNLLLLSVATAYAEANGFDKIVLGNNLEEAGAYPDNEPEFINLFNRTLKLAVGDGKSVSVVMPVGNLMKHEIVAMGHVINAPMDKTWSCYHAKEKHCGECGPCYMRRTAFRINNLPEVIEYEV